MRKRSSTKPQRRPTFFTDRDLGHQVPDALARAGLSVERHDDHFDPSTPDTEWLREIGRRGWVALSHNKEIRCNALERDMVMRAGVPLFMLIGDTTHAVLAKNFVQTLPRIMTFLAKHQPPFIARVYRPSPVTDVAAGKPGRVELWLSLNQWRAALRGARK